MDAAVALTVASPTGLAGSVAATQFTEGGRLSPPAAPHTCASALACAAPDANGMGVEEALKKAGAKVTSFVRINVGEGIEKKEENFAEEVMKQVQASK